MTGLAANRRWRFAGAFAMALLACGAVPRSAAAEALRVIVTHLAPPLVPNSVIDLADTLGFYAREGLEVELLRVQQTPSAVAALRSGHGDLADISVSSALQLVARDQMKLRAVVAPNKAIPFLIAGRADIATPKGLEGRSFGIGRVGSLDHTLSRLVLSSKGVDVDAIKLIAIGQPRVRAQALLGGRVDATTMSIGVWTSLGAPPSLKVLVPQDSYFEAAPLLSKVNVVLADTLAKKRDLVRKYVRAIILASRAFAEKPSLWAEAMKKARTDVPKESLDRLARAYVRSWSVNGGLNLEQVAYTTDRQYRGKDFSGLRKVPAAEWIETGLIDEVLADVGVVRGLDSPGR